MQRYKLTLEYDGTGLAGWQRQDNVPSVQALLEDAIYAFCQESVTTFCAGRTDAGVHARGQVVHVDLLTNRNCFTIRQGLNYHLEQHPLKVLTVDTVSPDFHARFSAKQRHYRYYILNRPAPAVLDTLRAWHVHRPLNLKSMQYGAQYLLGKHDFTSFRAAGCQANDAIRTLNNITIMQHDDFIIIDVAALSFLYHQVRNIVGSLVKVGMGDWQPVTIWKVLHAKDRSHAGQTAPAYGLYFMRVDY